MAGILLGNVEVLRFWSLTFLASDTERVAFVSILDQLVQTSDPFC